MDMNFKIRLMSLSATKTAKQKSFKFNLFCEQILDSCIVGGIAGLSTFVAAGEAATLKVFLLAFGLTFLLKLKDYRGIKEAE